MSHPNPSKAAREIGQHCLAMRLRRLTRDVTHLYDEALRAHDLRIGQLTVLVLVDSRGQARHQDVEEILHMERSTVSRTIARIVERGWLESRPDEDDARSRVLVLTPEGRALLERALPDWRRAQRQAQKLVSALGIEALAAIPAAD